MATEMTVDKTEEGITQEAPRRKSRPGVRAWQQKNKKTRVKIDPFVLIVFIYLIFSLTCLFWFGWKYYTLKREVARLSEIMVTLYEERATAQPYNVMEQQEPAGAVQNGTQVMPDSTGTAPAASAAPSTMYTVQAGDTWWGISQAHYGSGSYYLKLASYNKNRPLYSGTIIELPPQEVLDSLP